MRERGSAKCVKRCVYIQLQGLAVATKHTWNLRYIHLKLNFSQVLLADILRDPILHNGRNLKIRKGEEGRGKSLMLT